MRRMLLASDRPCKPLIIVELHKCRLIGACGRLVARSFGVLLWEMFSLGYMPYPGRSNVEVIDTVMNGGRLDIPRTCPTTVSDVMLSCWSRDADQRPSFADIVQRLQVKPHSLG